MWKTRFAFARDTRKPEDGLCKLIYTSMMTKHILLIENGFAIQNTQNERWCFC